MEMKTRLSIEQHAWVGNASVYIYIQYNSLSPNT